MQLPSIVERELQRALRRGAAVKTRLLFAGGATLLTFFYCLIDAASRKRTDGGQLFSILLGLGTYVAVVETLKITADVLSTERRNNTLGLLFLSGLSAGEIFLSKFLGAAVVSLSSLLTLVPCFAIPFLIGGIPLDAFIAVAFLLPNLLVFILSVSLVGSALSREDSMAIVLAAVLALGLCSVSPAVYWLSTLGSGNAISKTWLCLSPAYGWFLVYTLFKTGSVLDFWLNGVVTFLYSLSGLALAGMVLRHTWQEGFVFTRTSKWFHPLRTVARRMEASVAVWSGHLDKNPYTWVTLRDSKIVVLTWCVFAGSVLVWIIGFIYWRKLWTSAISLLATAFLVNALVAWLAVYSAARRIGEDRRSNALELLLTSPLSAEQIAEGLRHATFMGFRTLFLALTSFNLILFFCGLRPWDWEIGAMLSYLMAWGLVLIYGFLAFRSAFAHVVWISLNSGRPTYASLRPLITVVFFVIWMLFQSKKILSTIPVFPSGDYLELVLVGAVFFSLLIFAPVISNNKEKFDQLIKNIRIVARQPLPEPSDPRFKKWDTSKRFPYQAYETERND